MVRFMEQKEIFSRFLGIVNAASQIEDSKKGFRSGAFEYISNTNTIISKEERLKYTGFLEYEKDIDVHLYKVKEDLGTIYVEDESHQKLLVLTSTHDILKIERKSRLQQKHFFSHQ